MWIYTTPAVTQVHYGSSDTASAAYNAGANWVGVLFAAYNGFAALAAIVIPHGARLGLRVSHLVNAVLGGLACCPSPDPRSALAAAVHARRRDSPGLILSLPYALLSDSDAGGKDGRVHGHLQFLHRHPQLVAVSVLGLLVKGLFHNQPIDALLVGGVSLVLAGLFALRVSPPPRRGARRRRVDQEPRMTPRSRPRLAAFAACAGPHRDGMYRTGVRRGAALANHARARRVLRHAGARRQRGDLFLMTDRFVDGDPGNDFREQGGPGSGAAQLRRRCRARRPARATPATSAGDFRGIADHADHIRGMGFTGAVAHAHRRQPGRGLHRRRSGALGRHVHRPRQGRLPRLLGVNYRLDEHLPSPGLDFAGSPPTAG